MRIGKNFGKEINSIPSSSYSTLSWVGFGGNLAIDIGYIGLYFITYISYYMSFLYIGPFEVGIISFTYFY